MERDWPANKEGRDAHLLAVLQLVSTKSGVEFDATADVWTYRDGVNNVYLDFNQLPNSSREFRESAKSVLSWYAENRSPNHLRNMFDRLQHFLRASTRCRIPYDHMVACETGAGGSGTNLSWPASAYCS